MAPSARRPAAGRGGRGGGGRGRQSRGDGMAPFAEPPPDGDAAAEPEVKAEVEDKPRPRKVTRLGKAGQAAHMVASTLGGSLQVGDVREAADEGGSASSGSPQSSRGAGKQIPGAAESSSRGVTQNMNKSLMSRVAAAKQKIARHPDMGNVGTAMPLPLLSREQRDPAETSTIAPFDGDTCTACLTTTHAYGPVGFNIFQLDLNGNPAKRAHTNMNKLNSLVDMVFQNGFRGSFPDTFTAAVSVTDATQDVSDTFGNLVTASPPEMIWAVILGTAKLLDTSPTSEKVAMLRRGLITFPVKFTVSRESITAMGDAVKRTATQRFFDIMESKDVIETSLGHEVGAQRTAKMWAEKVELAPNSEKISETYVDACFTVGARLMSNAQTQKIVVEADSSGTTPFDSIYKYEAVVKRAQSGNLIHWCTAGLLDLVTAKMTTAGEISLRQLTGRGLPGGKGLLDLLIAKQELGHCIIKKVHDMGLNASTLQRLETWISGHDAYRSMVGYKAGEKDASWRTALKQSSKLAIALFEDCVFKVDFDLQIKQQKIQGSPVGEILDRSPLKEKVDAIYTALVAEGDAAPTDATADVTTQDLLTSDDDDELDLDPVKGKLSDPDLQEQLKPWATIVKNKYTRVVKLIVDPQSPTGVAEALSTWWEGLDMQVAKDSNIVVFYDAKLSGHPNARGHLRIVHFRDAHYDRMIKGSLAVLTKDDQPEDEMPPNVVYCVFDGGVHGNDHKFGKPFQNKDGKALKKDKRILFLQTTEKSLKEHRGNYSGVYGLPTMVFSEGSNEDPVIGNFDKPPRNDPLTWTVKHSDKPGLYNSAWILAGGAVAGDDAKADPGPRGKDTVPFNYHGMNVKVHKEVTSGVNGVVNIDLTCCNGLLAIHSLIDDVPYFGVCYSDDQKALADIIAKKSGPGSTGPAAAAETPSPKPPADPETAPKGGRPRKGAGAASGEAAGGDTLQSALAAKLASLDG
ncbi:unnamed protein product [Prorocentrum cordatum]|uniref:Uncharacterized protein n=1 Tax=Prorocentrum cordatum TaxID=2364126 RepID=A0ABN9XBQ9_9DINO|nr:unnamed protein product [Polarella glacialis]